MTREEAISAIQSNRPTSGYTILCEALDMAVAALREQEERQWIPVTERLPDSDGCYFCNVKSFAFPGSFYQRILDYNKLGFKEGRIYTDYVTHWMPLPEPPKEEKR